MNVSINQLVKTLLQKESLEQCSLSELTSYAERNPYFGAAQLLLAKKLQVEASDKYEEQYQKTLLYFHNPLWVEHLLNDTGKVEEEVGGLEVRGSRLEGQEVGGSRLEGQEVERFEVGGLEVGGSRLEGQEVEGLEVGGSRLEGEEVEREESLQVERVITEEKEIVREEDKMEEIESLSNNVEVQEVSIVEQKEEPEVPGPVEVVSQGNDLLFEPYHTVDYFASQGIKFKEEERPTDEFGKQLKRFTDWLKTLKRLPATELAKNVSAQSEQKVEQLAGQSITDREVLTEAMAEVWEKQGNSLKAIQIYSKLSLLEPAKSAYFAAKIEELKKKN